MNVAIRRDMASRRATGTSGTALQLAADEIRFLQADVVVGALDGELGPRLLEGVGHLRVHHRPDVLDLFDATDRVDLLPLVAAVEDVGSDDEEAVLEDQGEDAGELRRGVLMFRLEAPRGMRLAARGSPRRVLAVGGKAVAVVLELAAADIFEGEVAADEAVLRFAAGDAPDAPERRQKEEALVLGRRMFPDQEAGALDVVRIAEADEQAIAVGRGCGRAGCAAAAQRD